MSHNEPNDNDIALWIIYIILITLVSVINIWAIIAIIMNWNRLSTLSIIMAIIFLFIFPPISLIIAYGFREPEQKSYTHKVTYNYE